MRRRHVVTRAMALLAGLLAAAAAWAHKPSDSYLSLRAGDGAGTIAIRWDIALRDLDHVLGLDADGNGELTWGEVRAREGAVRALALGGLQLRRGPMACEIAPTAAMQLTRHTDGTYAVLALAARCPAAAGELQISYSLLFGADPSHRGLVQWFAPGATQPQALVLAPEPAPQASPAAPLVARQVLALSDAGSAATLGQYIADGMRHIWAGADHLLFLLALLLPSVLVRQGAQWHSAPSLRAAGLEVLKVVTAFTVAHSLTLAAATFGWLRLPSRLVESLVAASVVVAALGNLVPAATRLRRWPVAFGFGLIHGLGFAAVLTALGLPPAALALALLGFNLGVEAGQLAIVAVFLPLAWLLRGTHLYRGGIVQGGSLLVALIAAWWVVERAFAV